jgi:hypothetical protein
MDTTKPRANPHRHICPACRKLYVHCVADCTEQSRVCLQCVLSGRHGLNTYSDKRKVEA